MSSAPSGTFIDAPDDVSIDIPSIDVEPARVKLDPSREIAGALSTKVHDDVSLRRDAGQAPSAVLDALPPAPSASNVHITRVSSIPGLKSSGIARSLTPKESEKRSQKTIIAVTWVVLVSIAFVLTRDALRTLRRRRRAS